MALGGAIMVLAEAFIVHGLWPLVVLIVAFKFRGPLESLIDRIVAAEFWGAKVSAPLANATEQSIAAAKPEVDELAGLSMQSPILTLTAAAKPIDHARLEAVRNLGSNKPLVAAEMQAVESQLNDLGIEVGDSEAAKILLRHFSVVNIGFAFEKTFRLIFGSQLVALDVLKLTGTHNMQVLRPYYDEARAAEPQFYGSYTFEQWVGFLVTRNLVAVENGIVSITEVGREFLSYVSDLGMGTQPH